jgi:hypothetical protein
MHSSIKHFHARLAVAHCSSNELNARLQSRNSTQQNKSKILDFRTGPDECPLEFCVHSSLEQVNNFVEAIRLELRRHPNKTLIACVGRSDEGLRSKVAMLFGGFLILEEHMDFEQVAELFEGMGDGFDFMKTDTMGTSVHDCWRALSHARKLGWLHLSRGMPAPQSSDSPQDTPIEVEEMLHYASPINGDIHMVVPNKIVCFPTPADLPDNQLWMDSDATEGDTVRRFSAAFFADLFADLGVDVAVCLHTCAYDRAAFLEQGIEVEDLGMDPTSPHMLSAIDRFLAVAAAAPGLVALQSGSDGPGHLGALVLSYLTSRAGFDAESAVAWVRMVHPALLASPASPPALAATFHGDEPLARASSASSSPTAVLTASLPPARPTARGARALIRRTLSAPDGMLWDIAAPAIADSLQPPP